MVKTFNGRLPRLQSPLQMFPLRKMGKEAQDASSSRPPSHRQIHTSVHDVGSDVSIASVERPPSSHHSHQLPRSKDYHPFAPHVVCLLMPASIFGVLARLGLVALATYEGESIFPLAYVQALGCFVMGFALELREPLGKFYPPLYTALTTGFCGSLTTFSSWQLDVFNSWINATDSHRGGLRNFIDGLGKSVFTLSLAVSSAIFGHYVARVTYPRLPKVLPPTLPVRYAISVISVLIYVAVFPAYFRLPASFRHQATAALLFAFPGTLTRYVLSTYLNPLLQSFPLGTFTANSVGTGLLGAFQVIQSISNKAISPNACSILQGLDDGYCGCLTTVSTFAVEIRGLRGSERPRYVLLSWFVGQMLLLVIKGPSLLSGNVKKRVMCTFA